MLQINQPVNMNRVVGTHNILFITLDSLRYDVAQEAWAQGLLPGFSAILPASGWEKRHTPGNFTFAAHQAFFAGFLPTPAWPGFHPRLFASQFVGAVTAVEQTFIFEEPDMINALRRQGYHTVCIGGVGFFNKKTSLSRCFTDLFDQSHWYESFGVTNPESTAAQIEFILKNILNTEQKQPLFLFVNISATHQPNYFYLSEPDTANRIDTKESQSAALQYVDSQLPRLWKALEERGPLFSIICSDHGEAYGEDGFFGHRLNHDVVWTVPYVHYLKA